MKPTNDSQTKAFTEWAKHLRPYGKRNANKSTRKYGKQVIKRVLKGKEKSYE